MKYLLFFVSFLMVPHVNAQYVGINTTEPNATLDVMGLPDDATKADGIILPRLTLAQLNAKTSYSTEQSGALIYITDVTSGSKVPSTNQIISTGFYYFDGTVWRSSNKELFTGEKELTSTSSLKNTYVLDAGNENNIGKGNTAVGKNSLSYNLEGSNNTSYGDNALKYNEAGSDNTAVGNYALSNQLKSGSGNTALGSLSLYNNEGDRNTGIGKESLLTSRGNTNTALGYASGFGIENGTKNLSIGDGSGVTGDFSYTIAIGSGAKATKNKQIVIGTANNTETILFGTIKNNGLLMYYVNPLLKNYFLAGAGRENISDMTNLAYGNTGVGHEALQQVNNSPMNTAIGFQALQKLKNGADHTAVGAGALQNQTGGVGNSALGRLALAQSIVGTNNTGLGDTALEFTLGSQNTAVGYSAGIKAVSGGFNSLFGVFAGGHYKGRSGPDGSFSFCNVFGAETMMSNVSGSNNNLFGYRAGHIATAGDNAGFGHEVFRIMTTGTRNTAFGNESGWRLTTGTDNTFIGYRAGQNSAQKADVIGSTVIGANAYSTRSNEIVIGKLTDTHVTIMGVEFTKDELIKLKKLLSEN